jgi:hypothetical protein
MSADYAHLQHIRTDQRRGDKLRDLVQGVVRYCIEPFQAAVTEHELHAGDAFEYCMDVVIADAPAIDSSIARADNAGVHLAIEVTQTLNKRKLERDCNKIARAKSLPKAPGWNCSRTVGFLFAFSADTSLDTLARNLIAWCARTDPALWPSGIFVWDLGLITWTRPGRREMVYCPGAGLDIMVIPQDRDVLVPFLAYVHGSVAHHRGQPTTFIDALGSASFGGVGNSTAILPGPGRALFGA